MRRLKKKEGGSLEKGRKSGRALKKKVASIKRVTAKIRKKEGGFKKGNKEGWL